MVDSEMALTFSVRNNPGTYALLLGSGVSSGAEVPTGWGILKDLIRKIAAIQDEDPDDPIEWYENEYGEEPGYDAILEELAGSKAERQSLLEPYFEPTEREREEGAKTPSEAHRSIAWLVEEGYIDVIVTTNFDRLLEQALEERGVTPTRISTAAAAKGATPLRHEDAVILKINGDYKKTNIKNTSTELDKYDPALRNLLDQVFDEYGLIVCGWSAKYDTALRDAILECKSRRFSTFWAYRGDLEDEADELVEHRDGTAMQIEGASQFFTELKDNVQALEDAETGAPLTRDIARERVKRYLTRKERKIDLSDLLQEEAGHARDRIFDEESFPLDAQLDRDGLSDRFDRYEEAIETLVIACSTCAYWGPEVDNPVRSDLVEALRRVASAPSPEGTSNTEMRTLQKYPASVLMYAMGVPATESGNWKLIERLLVGTDLEVLGTELGTGNATKRSAVLVLNPSRLSNHIPSTLPPTLSSRTVFVKRHIREGVRSPLRDLIIENQQFEDAFSRFELLGDLVVYDRYDEEIDRRAPTVPDRLYRAGTLDWVSQEIDEAGEDWGPLQVGLFDGSVDRIEEILDEFNATP